MYKRQGLFPTSGRRPRQRVPLAALGFGHLAGRAGHAPKAGQVVAAIFAAQQLLGGEVLLQQMVAELVAVLRRLGQKRGRAGQAQDCLLYTSKLEMEIAQLDEEEATVFMEEFGIAEPALSRMIRASYDLVGLQSFFTVGEDEVRAWTVRKGAPAVEAAGAIHTDLAKGFILSLIHI